MKLLRRAVLALGLIALSACATTATPTGVDSAVNAPRVIALQGAQNFRDIGGYRTADGRHVKWGLIYRSAALSGLTDADRAQLSSLGVRTVYDLRSTQERRAAPDAWMGEGAPANVAHDYDLNSAAIAASVRSADANAVRTAMATSYPGMLTSLTPEYRDLFAGLQRGDGGTLYHCTAGKDRTGIATALILSALGVPRETIMSDYLMSNRYYHPASGGMMGGLPPDVAQALIGVDASYLQTTFTTIDAQYGSVENYLNRELGVDAAGMARLRALYTE